MKNFLLRLKFALKHKTLKAIAPDPQSASNLFVFSEGKACEVDRLCPHQGADLRTATLENNKIVCPWHGCKIPLKTEKTRSTS